MVDVTHLASADCTFLHLLRAHRQTPLRVAGRTPQRLRVLENTTAETVLDIHTTVSDVLAQ
ncbi:hypothetical protein [Streptomyces sp. NPDC001500]